MNKELPKAYEAKNYEDKTYKLWEESGFFNPDNLDPKGEPFTIIMPPPNATGQLHVGHAVMLAIEDLMIRYQRMQGKRALWLPGTDHAAIATNAKVEQILKKEGTSKHEIGQEKFIKRVEEFISESQGTIKNQVRKMGSSCDWSRERYTMDEGLTKAVQEMFVKMYQDDLIYQGERLVNWCPHCHSTLSDDEVEHKENQDKLYWIKYGPFTLATTRPETKLGDTAVAVHPEDERYKDMIGKKYMIPGVLGEFEITVVGDKSVDPEFGSGAVKVTPSHSFADAEIAERHGIKGKKIIDEDGKMLENCGKYAGMTTTECRKEIVKDMKKMGLIEKIEDYKNNLSICYRCGTAIEPIPSKQWFVKVESLKKKAIDVVKNGEIEMVPERFGKIYLHWMENLHDWCISRQIWFGHRMPLWHKDGEVKVQVESPGSGWEQETDTLDTWFSSGMWTFSTLGWPEKTDDFKTFHPTSVMETGYDILPLWVSRMILMTTYALDEVPFKTVYLHGLVRTRTGEKMSKSKPETNIDPLDMIDKYGADALRLSLLSGTTPGQDTKIYEEKIAGYRNFVNKLWNISRYILSKDIKGEVEINTLAERWIMSSQQSLIKEVSKLIDEYQFSLASEKIYNWMWHDFADWYLEINKKEKNDALLIYLLENLLKLLHPFTPYVTEVIYKELDKDSLLMVAEWPKIDNSFVDEKAEKEFQAWRKEEIKSRIKPEDLKKQMAKIDEDIKATEKYIKQVEGRLKNQNFVLNAPEAVVMEEKERLDEAKKKIEELNNKKELYG